MITEADEGAARAMSRPVGPSVILAPRTNAQAPKVRAYRLLMAGGMSPKAAVAYFAELLKKTCR